MFCVLDLSADCSTFQTNASGSINSLNYPASYPPNKQCTWLIAVPGSKNIALIFTQFDVSQSSNPGNCSDDYVEVRNGLTDTSPVIGGKHCNRNRAMLITTRSNVARIYFHTGRANLSHRGFLIYFLSVTQGILIEKSFSLFYSFSSSLQMTIKSNYVITIATSLSDWFENLKLHSLSTNEKESQNQS